MLSENIQQALNKQLNAEFLSAYTYLSVAAYFEGLDLNGFAHWMKIQYQEELMHAERIYTFINDRDGRVLLQALDMPQSEWDSRWPPSSSPSRASAGGLSIPVSTSTLSRSGASGSRIGVSA